MKFKLSKSPIIYFVIILFASDAIATAAQHTWRRGSRTMNFGDHSMYVNRRGSIVDVRQKGNQDALYTREDRLERRRKEKETR